MLRKEPCECLIASDDEIESARGFYVLNEDLESVKATRSEWERRLNNPMNFLVGLPVTINESRIEVATFFQGLDVWRSEEGKPFLYFTKIKGSGFDERVWYTTHAEALSGHNQTMRLMLEWTRGEIDTTNVLSVIRKEAMKGHAKIVEKIKHLKH